MSMFIRFLLKKMYDKKAEELKQCNGLLPNYAIKR